MIVAVRPPFGQTRLVYTADAYAGHAASLRTSRRLDRVFVAAHLEGAVAHDRTIFSDVRAVPPGHALVRTGAGFATRPSSLAPRRGALAALLRDAIARAMRGRRAAVALSGGLDSAIVLTLAREVDRRVPAYVVAPQIAGYSELEPARRTGGRDVHVVDVASQDLVAALPDALVTIEEPLYNLHPVSRLLLGRALRDDGIEVVLTGDGADQVSARDASADYVPLVHALTAASGVDVAAPFLDDAVVAHLLSLPADPDKPAIREIGRALGLDAVSRSPKRRSLGPPLDLTSLVPVAELAALACRLDRPLDLACDRARVRWTSLALLARHLEVDV